MGINKLIEQQQKPAGISGAVACPEVVAQLKPQATWLQSKCYAPIRSAAQAPVAHADIRIVEPAQLTAVVSVDARLGGGEARLVANGSFGSGSGNSRPMREARGNRPWRERT